MKTIDLPLPCFLPLYSKLLFTLSLFFLHPFTPSTTHLLANTQYDMECGLPAVLEVIEVPFAMSSGMSGSRRELFASCMRRIWCCWVWRDWVKLVLHISMVSCGLGEVVLEWVLMYLHCCCKL